MADRVVKWESKAPKQRKGVSIDLKTELCLSRLQDIRKSFLTLIQAVIVRPNCATQASLRDK